MALVSFAGALLALWLVRERDIEREAVAPREQSTALSGAPA